MLPRDPELLALLEHCRQEPFEGVVNRVVWAERSPFQGSNSASGRWSSPDSQFEILNTSFSADGADAEFAAFWSLFEQRPDREALNWKLRVQLMRVVELSFAELGQLGIEATAYRRRDYTRTQEISDALNYLGCDGLIAPSARYDSNNLIVYMQNLDKDGLVDRTDRESSSGQIRRTIIHGDLDQATGLGPPAATRDRRPPPSSPRPHSPVP